MNRYTSPSLLPGLQRFAIQPDERAFAQTDKEILGGERIQAARMRPQHSYGGLRNEFCFREKAEFNEATLLIQSQGFEANAHRRPDTVVYLILCIAVGD